MSPRHDRSGFPPAQKAPPPCAPFVYDDAARELKQLADRRLIEIVSEQTMRHADEQLIGRLSFRRLR